MYQHHENKCFYKQCAFTSRWYNAAPRNSVVIGRLPLCMFCCERVVCLQNIEPLGRDRTQPASTNAKYSNKQYLGGKIRLVRLGSPWGTKYVCVSSSSANWKHDDRRQKKTPCIFGRALPAVARQHFSHGYWLRAVPQL